MITLGMQFGDFTCIEKATGGRWHCQCDCGAFATITAPNLRRRQYECGGYHATQRKPFPRHRKIIGSLDERLRIAYDAMLFRTSSPGYEFPHIYQARGIQVCDEWASSYRAFADDMAPHPGPGFSLDRIDNEQGYSKSNCRWATGIEQGRNRRNNKHQQQTSAAAVHIGV